MKQENTVYDDNNDSFPFNLLNNSQELNDVSNNNLIINDYLCIECNAIPEITNVDYNKSIIEKKCPKYKKIMSLSDFINEIKNQTNKLICKLCNKRNDKDGFKYCYLCNKIICPVCFVKHDKSHNMIDYYEYNNKCKIHFNQIYTSFCLFCKKNICYECKKSKEHKEHKRYDFIEIMPNENEIEQIKDFCFKLKNNLEIIEHETMTETYELKNIKEERILIIDQIYQKQNDNKIDEINQKLIDLEEMCIKKLNEIYLIYINYSEKVKEYYKNLKAKYEEEKENILNANKINFNKAKFIIQNKYDKFIKEIQKFKKQLKMKYNNIIELNDIIINSYFKNKNQYYYIINVENIINSIKKFKEEKPQLLIKELNKKYKLSLTEKNIEIEKNIITNQGIKNIIKRIDKDKVEKLYIHLCNVNSLSFLMNYNFANLKYLFIINCNINSIETFRKVQIPQLKILDLSYNRIEDIESIKYIKANSLEVLNLCENKIININVLENEIFKTLKVINLSHNQISDISVFNKAKFKKITTILLDFNNIKDFKHLNKENLKDLINLKIGNQSFNDNTKP